MTEAERQGPPQQYDEQGRPIRYVYVERVGCANDSGKAPAIRSA